MLGCGDGGKMRFVYADKQQGIIDDCLNEICTKRYVHVLVRWGVYDENYACDFLGQENMTADNHLETASNVWRLRGNIRHG